MATTIEKTLTHIEMLTQLMDDQFEVLGIHFGLNFLIDLVPEIGDLITTAIALYIVSIVMRYKIPKRIVAHMLFNIFIYFLIGLVPWLGDIFGTWWKPNRRNLELLRTHVRA